MSRSNDPGHYFQTTSALNETARKATKSTNTKGSPIKLPSKILAAVADPQDENQIYVAEAAGNIKRINIEVVFAGCWDKSIWSWARSSRKPGRRYQGHTDFVKAVLVCKVQDKELLISASADASIIVWDTSSGEKLHTLKGHRRGILALAIDPIEYQTNTETIILVSAGTDREIRRWSIALASAAELQPSPIISHETSIDAIHFDSDGDLWTASADKTAKCLSRGREWEQDSKFEHPDFVRDVAIDEDGGWTITACRDEEIRVWDKATGKLHHVFSGHFEEVTGLVLLSKQRLVSVSIDATVRQWSLKPQELDLAIKEAEDERLGKTQEPEPEKKEGMMTAEEEAELAELLEDSE